MAPRQMERAVHAGRYGAVRGGCSTRMRAQGKREKAACGRAAGGGRRAKKGPCSDVPGEKSPGRLFPGGEMVVSPASWQEGPVRRPAEGAHRRQSQGSPFPRQEAKTAFPPRVTSFSPLPRHIPGQPPQLTHSASSAACGCRPVSSGQKKSPARGGARCAEAPASFRKAGAR